MSAAGDAAGSGGGIAGAIKGLGTGGAILGGLDIAEGGGLDKARGAVDEAVIGLQQAAASAGDVLRGIFGFLPWEDPTQIAPVVGGNATNATNATGAIVPHTADILDVVSVLF